MSFEYPEITRGNAVEVSNDPSRSDRAMGWVIDAKNHCADIIFFTTQHWGIKKDCWYEGDPRNTQFPEHFEGNISGVFNLTEGELMMRSIQKRIDTLDSNQAILAGEVARMEAGEPRATVSGVRRGRPPKVREAELIGPS